PEDEPPVEPLPEGDGPITFCSMHKLEKLQPPGKALSVAQGGAEQSLAQVPSPFRPAAPVGRQPLRALNALLPCHATRSCRPRQVSTLAVILSAPPCATASAFPGGWRMPAIICGRPRGSETEQGDRPTRLRLLLSMSAR